MKLFLRQSTPHHALIKLRNGSSDILPRVHCLILDLSILASSQDLSWKVGDKQPLVQHLSVKYPDLADLVFLDQLRCRDSLPLPLQSARHPESDSPLHCFRSHSDLCESPSVRLQIKRFVDPSVDVSEISSGETP